MGQDAVSLLVEASDFFCTVVPTSSPLALHLFLFACEYLYWLHCRMRIWQTLVPLTRRVHSMQLVTVQRASFLASWLFHFYTVPTNTVVERE